MKRTSFNDDWRVRPKANLFMEMFGAGPGSRGRRCSCHTTRCSAASEEHPNGHWGTGYFPGGVWEYEKTFVVTDEQHGKIIALEFEGVYRDASVWVNGVLAERRPYGYSDFVVTIAEHLRYGEENKVRVDATARTTTGWYSGGGIYRPVHLPVGRASPRRTRRCTRDDTRRR